jgi:NitT/TauT family transport system substrate-binding protein
MQKAKLFFIPVFLTLSLGIAWELYTTYHQELLFVLPAPSKIFLTFLDLKERLWFHTWATLKEMIGGATLAFVVSFPLAFLMHRHLTTRLILQPLFLIIQCLPMFTLAPLMVLWCGWGYLAIVIPTALMIFFPLTLSIYQGLRATPQEHLDFFELHQAGYFQTLFKLRLPYALPHIFAGLRISAAVAGVGAIAGEWAGAQSGLGILMLESRRNTDLEITFCALIALTLLSSSLYLLILFFEKKVFRRYLFPSLKNGAIFSLFLALLFLASCQKEKPKHQLLLDWIPNVNHIPLYVGVEKHFFENEGLPIKIKKMYDAGSSLSYLTANQADLIISHLPSVLKATSKGAKLKLMASLINRPLRAFIYHQDLNIHSPEDLSGKVLGYCLGGPNTNFLDFLLRKSAITPSNRRNVSVDLISPMGTRQIDFLYGGYWNIETYQLRALGVPVDALPLDTLGFPSYDELVVVTLHTHTLAHPQAIEKFQRALKKSIAFCRENPEEALSLYFKANPDKSILTKSWEKEAWDVTLSLFSDDLNFKAERVESFYEWQKSEGIVDCLIPLTDVL